MSVTALRYVFPTLLLCAAPWHARAELIACEHARFEGRCEVFQSGVSNLRSMGFNDTISSVRARHGGWLLCTDAAFEGSCEAVTGAVENLAGTPLQDSISSLRPLRRDEWAGGAARAIEVFVHADFRGRSTVFHEDVANLKEFGLNDEISSLRVLSGRWEVCVDSRFRECVEIQGEVRNLGDLGLNDALSSIRQLPDRPQRGRERRRGSRY